MITSLRPAKQVLLNSSIWGFRVYLGYTVDGGKLAPA